MALHLELLAGLLSIAAQGLPESASGDGSAAGRGGPHELELQAGWRDLLAAESLPLWRAAGGADLPEGGWEIEPFALRRLAAGGPDLVCDLSVGDYELVLEWRSEAGPTAPWSTARELVRGGRFERWVQGQRVLSGVLGMHAAGPGDPFESRPPFGARPPERGRIGLPGAGGELWLRNLYVRDLEQLPGRPVQLVRADSLEGWQELGDARWSVEGGAIRGRVGGGGQSFLRTQETFGDFLLELELQLHGPGNSGIQVRSREDERGRVRGYQIEIDPSPRAWSGGLYDEGRRGWLQDLKELPAARAALDPQGWNHYRIECLGPWIRSWINGVPATDHFDPVDLEGFIALQVHSGRDADLTWRSFELRDLGRRAWITLAPAEVLDSWRTSADAWSAQDELLVARARGASARLTSPAPWTDFTLRFEVRALGDAHLRLLFRHTAPVDLGAQEPVPLARVAAFVPSPDGWILDTAHPSFEARAGADGWTRLSLAVYGERIALHAGDHLIADLRDAAIPRAGSTAFEISGSAGRVELRRVQLLGPPR